VVAPCVMSVLQILQACSANSPPTAPSFSFM
jgi:hypothetical protein